MTATPGAMLRRWRAFGRVAAGDLMGRRGNARDPRVHLAAAIAWLKRAQDKGQDGGVSYGYCLQGGWRPPYRETSGYISSTFFDLAERLDDPDARARALAICRWLRRVQNGDGSIANPRYGPDGIVFDTGQVLGGYVRAFRETGDAAFLDAAQRAAGWLVAVADGDGRWTRNTFGGVPHAYNTRTAWALLDLAAICAQTDYTRVALANLDWAVGQQRPTGWFDHCAFTPGVAPFTHTIAYTLEGLLEAGLLLDQPRYVEAARRGAEAALQHLRADGFVPGQIDVGGNPVGAYSCLSGNCQLAAVWAKLYHRFREDRFRMGAVDTLRYVMTCQDLDTVDGDMRGAIKGSHPVWGAYAPFAFPNWAAKFFIDAMLPCLRWL
jgi:hypothetical protein